MSSYIRNFNGYDIRVVVIDGKVLFKLIDVAYAVGYAKASSLRYHTKNKKREIHLDDGIYLKLGTIGKVAKAANKTPYLKLFFSWASGVAEEVIEEHNRPKANIPVVTTYTISVVASILRIHLKELSDWLVDEGYAGRYASNNSIYFSQWFKDQGYGSYPKINDEKGERVSRSPRITQSGLEYIKARLESQRQSNVLFFAKKEVFQEEKKFEDEIDDLIRDTFSAYRHCAKYDYMLQPNKVEYRVDEDQLIKFIKGIIAQVKLKE